LTGTNEDIEVALLDHGEYSLNYEKNILDTDGNENRAITSQKIKIRKLDNDIYEFVNRGDYKDDIKFNKLIKVADGTKFQRVREITLDLMNPADLDNLLNKYEFSKVIEDDLLQQSMELIEKRKKGVIDFNEFIVTIYTPKMSIDEMPREKQILASQNVSPKGGTWSPYTKYYYTGYGNQKYCDEVLKANASTGFYVVKRGSAVRSWLDQVFQNLVIVIVQGYIEKQPWGAPVNLYFDIFGGTIAEGHPSTPNDYYQVNLFETKYKKLTQIRELDYATNEYFYVTRAISERATDVYVKHQTFIDGVDTLVIE